MIAEQVSWLERFVSGSKYREYRERPIAYFCAEYAITDELPIFAGGLGILAGDYLREAEDRDVPVVAVGLYYAQGFTRKELSPEGRVVETHQGKRPEEAGLKRVLDERGEEMLVKVPIQDKEIVVRAWLWEPENTKGEQTVKLYLLDTNLPQNTTPDQHITDTLYVTDKELRFKQEIVLGVGGLRMLTALKYHPKFYHLNEGHSAMLIFELIRHEMEEHQVSFDQAVEIAKKHVLFTNHTLVAAGNDVFSNDMVALQLSRYAEELGVPVTKLVNYGLVQDSSSFSMTMLAMRMAGKVNGVSKLHTAKAKEIWTDHPMFPITNGIHIRTWDRVGETGQIWERHKENKRKLLMRICETTGVMWDEKEIIIGWARRIVRYKRPLALVERLKRFGELARSTKRPVRVVYAGLSHPADTDGAEILEELQYRLNSDLKGAAVYLPHYNMELAALMTAGCDVWINTPIVGYEACGTSGMKAALNGGLPLTTIDGWMAEVEMLEVGWGLVDDKVTDDLLDRLEQDVLPLYYDKNEQGVPEKWVTMMKNARELVMNEFAMTRALRQYLEEGVGITS